MIIFKIIHVATHRKRAELWYMKVLLIDQAPVLNYLVLSKNSSGKPLRKGIWSYEIG